MSIIGDAYLRALAIQAHMFGQMLRGEPTSFPSFERPATVRWMGFDHTQPYPWGTVPCPGCEETELAIDVMRPPDGFVCMACGCQTLIEQ